MATVPGAPRQTGRAPVETALVHAHGLAALVTLLLSATFGIVISIQLWAPDVGAGAAWLSWGRLRYAHTQGIMLGWLANAFFAFLYHACRASRADPSPVRGWNDGCLGCGMSW